MHKLIKKNKWAIAIFIVSFTYLLLGNFGSCEVYQKLNFDSQELFTWSYLSTTTYSLYGDYYYPYGLLNYLKNVNGFFYLISLIIIPAFFTVIFVFLQKLWLNPFIASIQFAAFVIFILTITGLPSYNRYGMILFIGIIYVLLFASRKSVVKRIVFGVGLLNGIIFSLINDQGIYGVVLFIFCVFIDPIIKNNINVLTTKEYYVQRFIKLFWFIVGFILGAIPFFIFLYATGSLLGFLTNITTISDNAEYGKTPFLHSIKSIENVFIILSIIVTSITIVWKIYTGKFKSSIFSYSMVVMLFIIVLIEQKNIIRSIDTQITFLSFFLFSLLFVYLKQVFINNKISQHLLYVYYCIFVFGCLSLFGALQPNKLFDLINNWKITEKNILEIWDVKKSTKTCVEQNLKMVHNNYPEYSVIIDKLSKDKEFNNKVYSFPGEPIYYVLLEQKPPYYSALYEASPLYAQNKIIEYIKEQDIRYVVYNYKNFAIQDNVPNFLRGATLHSYMMANYVPKQIIGGNLILEKDKNNNNFFQNPIINSIPELKKSLLQVNLGDIPRSEGMYKAKYLSNNIIKKIYSANSITELNQYFKKNKVYSKDLFLVITKKDKKVKNTNIAISVNNGLQTSLTFTSCDVDMPCIINLSNLPLFYTNRQLISISGSKNENFEIDLVTIKDNILFW